MLPPIRYPLPTLLALVLTSLLAWFGAEMTKGWRAEMADRLKRTLEGPPVPSSPKPQIFAGSVPKLALLLTNFNPTTRPNGPAAEPIDRRMFVDVYDTWPDPGPITHVRVGNRKAAGWLPIGDVLLWNTRLVIQAPEGRLMLAESPTGPTTSVEVGRLSLPVLAWTDQAVEVAVWDPAKPWMVVNRRGWLKISDLPAGAWGIWTSQVELPILLGLANQGDSPQIARLRAVLGRLAVNRPLTGSDLDAIRKVLPSFIFDRDPSPQQAARRLAEANAQTSSEAEWSGLNFRFLPLDDLP